MLSRSRESMVEGAAGRHAFASESTAPGRRKETMNRTLLSLAAALVGGTPMALAEDAHITE